MESTTWLSEGGYSDDVRNRIPAPDPLAMDDCFAISHRSAVHEPEKQLMHAVLADAISTYRLCHKAKTGQRRRRFLEVQRWLSARGDDWPFSFENICAVLGLEPGYLRAGLRRWKEKQERAMAAGQAGAEKLQKFESSVREAMQVVIH